MIGDSISIGFPASSQMAVIWTLTVYTGRLVETKMELPVKYSVPRNKQIPDPSFADILNSGALDKDKAGAPGGDHFIAYRGNDPRLPKSALIPAGKLFPFKFGLIYVPEVHHDFFTETLRASANLAFWGASIAAVGALPLPLSAAVYAGIDLATSPERPAAEPLKDVADLVKRGAVYLPGVQIVEIEHQVDPGGFLSKKIHRLIVTYERLDAQRTSYTFVRFDAPKAQLVIDALISIILRSRCVGEYDCLGRAVKSEYVDTDSIWAATIEKYQTRYGADWGKHVHELIAEANDVMGAELNRKGFTMQRLMAGILKRITPLIPYYQQVPGLKEWVRELEEAAGAAPAATAG